jgi:hypothetical protein
LALAGLAIAAQASAGAGSVPPEPVPPGTPNRVDPAVIGRIESAAGTGSALHGRSAFVGLTPPVGERGPDLQDAPTRPGQLPSDERRARLSGGGRHADGSPWLASLSLERSEGHRAAEIGELHGPESGASWDRWLSEARRGEWSAQLTAVERRDVQPVPYRGYLAAQAHRVLTLAHDTEPVAQVTASTRVTLGDYRGRFDAGQGVEWLAGHRGRGWSADSQWTYDGIAGHHLVAGVLFRQDFRRLGSSASTEPDHEFAARYELAQRSLALSIEDEVLLGPDCHGSFGLQVDRRDDTVTRSDPRGALACDLADGWTAHLSRGRATHFPSQAEEPLADAQPQLPESITTTAAVVERRHDALRFAASLYHHRIHRPQYSALPEGRLDGQGAVVELEWQRAGWHVHGSQAWQSLRDAGGARPSDSPRTVTRLLLSAPLDGERARLSATLHSLGAFHRSLGEATPRQTQVDLAGLWRPDGSHWAWGLGLRNLLNQRSVDFVNDPSNPDPLADRPPRSLWLSVVGTWP